jgi:hypothetical protein
MMFENIDKSGNSGLEITTLQYLIHQRYSFACNQNTKGRTEQDIRGPEKKSPFKQKPQLTVSSGFKVPMDLESKSNSKSHSKSHSNSNQGKGPIKDIKVQIVDI